MAPRNVPWWRIDCDADESDKLARLPNDSARWAWFRAGCRAKTQRRMGIFGGLAHLEMLLGRHGRYIPDLVRVGSLHTWPDACPRCVEDYAEDATDGDLVMHDYRRKQTDPTAALRQSVHRSRVTLSSRDSNGVGNGIVTPSSRAPSPSLSMSPSLEKNREPYQVGNDPPDDSDALIGWLALNHHVVVRPGNGWHVRMMQWFAQGATVETAKRALTEAVEAGNRMDRQVVPAAEDILFPRSQGMTREERKRREYADADAWMREGMDK